MDNALTPRRDGAVDLAKALAICAVVLIHCSANHFAHHPADSFQWLAACFWGSVSRWAVPVFLLCSGALMNAPGRDLPLKKLFSRYLLRLALALAVWAGLYELLRIYMGRGGAPLSQLAVQSAQNWLTGTTYYHLYYFYFAIALYLALPLTRLIARHASRAELRYLLALWFLAGSVIPFCRYFPPFDQLGASLLRYSLPAIFLSPGLGLLGWYLGQHPPKSCREGLVLFLAGFGVTFLGTWRRSAAAGELDQFFLDGFGLFVLLMAAGVFRLCQRLGRDGVPEPVLYLSRASFCVYLIHPYFQWLTRQAFFETLSPVWAVPAQALLLLGLSAAAYEVLRRVPVVSRWII